MQPTQKAARLISSVGQQIEGKKQRVKMYRVDIKNSTFGEDKHPLMF
jgi:hypothetical protein